jgi:hypothetical protein
MTGLLANAPGTTDAEELRKLVDLWCSLNVHARDQFAEAILDAGFQRWAPTDHSAMRMLEHQNAALHRRIAELTAGVAP